MPRRATLLKSLSRGRVRTSFNKYNLFNLYKKGQVDFRSKTLYQQKWTAKQETRAYHGEHLTEKRWQSVFNPKLDSVAQLDASLKGGKEDETPFLLQTFAVLEKRLDFAVFRAMFASSVRQARQFILQGNVFVNGIKIAHPNYTLKPGDVFRVRPSKVLEALGAKKPSIQESLKVDKIQVTLWNKYVKEAKLNPRAMWDRKLTKYREMDDSNPQKLQFLAKVKEHNKDLEQLELKSLNSCTPTNMLTQILTVYSKSEKEPESLSIDDFASVVDGDMKLAGLALECFQEVNKSKEFTKESLQKVQISELSHRLLAPTEEMKNKMSDGSKVAIRSAKKHLSELTKLFSSALRRSFDKRKGDQNAIDIPYDENWSAKLQYHPRIDPKELAEDEKKAQESMNLPWQQHLYGRANPKRPYFTPWKPRPFLAPFAVLPHHLEISFKTCHAVYLRDPVARPGHSEVISPFDLPVHERAYMYYVRRGK
ncbi:hypothetical protein ZYGR_0AV02460 [Zygosaccharomyces rouxii]|uniref:Small ribosomal subunit protein uS4m n=1 Tax=Zygosaccharomyces rouxii TaxID=4956 RepID=A0A1Q3A5B2_ZYGRO|nr:hypothetical protein ZYGR_0AA00110 [Zygosaccharomyces rouxii]GAV55614.1 hypothetical protein ZYGR_0AV02460 [Zygosaccharomyces rouxii]